MVNVLPLSVSILCQSRLFLLLGKAFRASTVRASIHPLSIEAISPTSSRGSARFCFLIVSILCQSRLFLLQSARLDLARDIWRVSILCQSRLFLLPTLRMVQSSRFNRVSILCQSRLFLLLGGAVFEFAGGRFEYPSSVNRGYFSYISESLGAP